MCLNCKDIYNNTLFNSGFKQKIKFDPNFGNNNSQNKIENETSYGSILPTVIAF